MDFGSLIPADTPPDLVQDCWLAYLEGQPADEQSARTLISKTVNRENSRNRRIRSREAALNTEPTADFGSGPEPCLDALERLNEADANLLTNIHLTKIPMAEVGRRLGISQPTLRLRHSQAVEKIKILLR
jgi:DNA-directed RNA polymerase specialized sigma24 family protein